MNLNLHQFRHVTAHQGGLEFFLHAVIALLKDADDFDLILAFVELLDLSFDHFAQFAAQAIPETNLNLLAAGGIVCRRLGRGLFSSRSSRRGGRRTSAKHQAHHHEQQQHTELHFHSFSPCWLLR